MGFRLLDWLMDHLMPWFVSGLLILMTAVLVLLPVSFYVDATSPTFSLKKDEWTCAKTHTEVSSGGVLVGNVLVPTTSKSTVCDMYARKP